VLGDIVIRAPLISFCIATFNRGEKVHKLVNNILNFSGDEIEVIVSDNCSTDNTRLLLSSIKDSRFLFIENEVNKGPLINGLMALSSAKATYAFICLDKDWFDYRSIERLIARLYEDADVVYGNCSLNLAEEGPDIIYEKGFPSLVNMAYKSQHPSGIFYNTTIFKSLSLVRKVPIELLKYAFYVDLLNAEMSMYGKTRLINLPAFYTETKDEAKKIPSLTYAGEDLFFSPTKRIEQFNISVESLQRFELTKKDFNKLISILFNRSLMASTFEYKKILSDDALCAHYCISVEKVRFLELWKTYFLFSLNFLNKNLNMSLFRKWVILFFFTLKFAVRSILNG
jgi:glycosyltransferase involved in cell wall biosynthesis